MKTQVFSWLLIFLSGLQPLPTIAAPKKPPSFFFQAARKSFQAGDYDQALHLFQEARAAGLDKPSLFYNLGVCAYRLGRYQEARDAFQKTATFPQMAALAYYNLAVVAEKEGKRDEAVRWLNKTLHTAGSKEPKLILLAQTALARLAGSDHAEPQRLFYGSLGIGFDDNVAMTASDDLELTSEEEDMFTELFAFGRGRLWQQSDRARLYWQGNLSLRDYSDVNDYDSGSFMVEARYLRQVERLQIEAGAGYGYVLWDLDGYSQTPCSRLQATYSMDNDAALRFGYTGTYRDIVNGDYDYLQGWQHLLTGEYSKGFKKGKITLGYSLEENNRRDADFSPRRHSLRLAVDLQLLDRLSAHLATSYRDSFYNRSGREDRREDRYQTTLLLSYSLSAHWEIVGRYAYTLNISSEPLYDYRRSVTSLSIGYTF